MTEEFIIEAAANYAEENQLYIEDQMGDMQNGIEELSNAYKAGAKWMQKEFLKGLWHPVSEEPKNLEYIIFASEIFGETYFFTVQRDNSRQSWEIEIACHGIDQWAYRNDIVSLILKGGYHD